MPPATILRLTGFADAAAVEGIFASYLVDIAYVEDVTPTAVLVSGDPAVPLVTADDREWLRSIIEEIVRDNWELGTRVEWVDPTPPRP